jgi:POT family proton-dependent oligopeptide transporter
MTYRTSPSDQKGMPSGIPHIIGNEAAERFSFYGMKAVLAVFMASYLHLMDGTAGTPMHENEATEKVHLFNAAVYLTPFLGALLSDIFLGKYRTIILLSVVYCLGHAALAFMGTAGNSAIWLFAGLGLIALGSGGIKPCVSAHVGDQFGKSNSHLLPRVFAAFYFSINVGAAVSMALTPWLLEWYGPHWAFGVPGVLMAIASLVFWLGRHRFVHVPAGGMRFFREIASPEGRNALLKLLPIYLLVAVFWALFDQTGSTWVFQAQDMDRRFLGIDWLPSQVQSLNSVFVLTFVPLFSLLLYPFIGRFCHFTALKKIGTGLALMALSFAIVAAIQGRIDAGGRPNIGWQVFAYALLTASEVMVSIIALEFAYTQAPKTMKSLVMCFYLGAVALGNIGVAALNHVIQIPSAARIQLDAAVAKLEPGWRDAPQNIVLGGHDGTTGTADDYIARMSKGQLLRLEIPGEAALRRTAERIKRMGMEKGSPPAAGEVGDLGVDPWGNPIRYEIRNSATMRLISDGPDKQRGTGWDQGLIIRLPEPEKPVEASWTDRFHPAEPWLEKRKRELRAGEGEQKPDEFEWFVGGQSKLEGAAYFRLFAWLMAATTVIYLPVAMAYRPKTYLQD